MTELHRPDPWRQIEREACQGAHHRPMTNDDTRTYTVEQEVASADRVGDLLDAWWTWMHSERDADFKAYTQLRGQMIADLARVVSLEGERDRLREALEEIAKGEGRFSLDPLTFANNVIDDMLAKANEALDAAAADQRRETGNG